MAINPKTPGVYIEEISKLPPSIAAVETAIPAFIGYTEKAREKADNDLAFKPKRIVSMLEYVNYFGGPQPEENILVTINEEQDNDGNSVGIEVTADFDGARSKHLMYYCMQTFFANGGGPCYIVSTGPYQGQVGAAVPPGVAAPASLLYRGLEALRKEDEVTLIVFPENQGVPSIGDMKGLYDAALKQCVDLQDRFTVMDIYAHDSASDINAAADNFRNNGIRNGVDFLKYGAVYAPNIETILDYAYDASEVDVAHTIIGGPNAGPGPGQGKLNVLQTSDSALFARAQVALTQIPLILPAAAAVVGVYATVDNLRGVWKAPANESLTMVQKPVLKITRQQQDLLNIHAGAGKSVNAIRNFIGKGTLIWGARTLAGNDNEWRYISVRRFFNFVEESVKKGTERFVFEPNDANTWIKVRSMIENFLNSQWTDGALQGATPEQAFYVRVGLGETMTQLDILEGRMNVEIGMAVVRPAEFIILKFSHKLPEA